MHEWMGKKAKDRLTGFEGVITGVSQFMTGCDQFHLQHGCSEDGKLGEGHWFDEQRLELLGGPTISLDNKRPGACATPPSY